MDIVKFFNDLTDGHLLAWKTAVASLIVAQAALQMALAARFWVGGGLPIAPETAASIHRWNGRALIALSLVVGYVCLLVQAGPTSPMRILLHSIFGGTLFALLGAKLAAVRFSRNGGKRIPLLGVALFANYIAIWMLSAVDYVMNSSDPGPSSLLEVWVALMALALLALGGMALAIFVRAGSLRESKLAH
ncbi:MAG: DUF6529 family protein [Acidimicrobiales bacterium]